MNQQSPQQQSANQSGMSTVVKAAIITGIFTIVGGIITAIVAPIIVARLSSSPTHTQTPSSINTPTTAEGNPYTHTGTLILSDSLSDNNKGNQWFVGMDNSGGDCEFTGGAYHVSTPSAGHICGAAASPDLSNFVFEVQMTIIKGDFGGVEFRVDSMHPTQHYTFHVGQDGTYALYLAQGPTITKMLIPTTPSSAIHQGWGQTNIIAVVAQGSTITLYINRQQIPPVTDNTYSHGRIALVAVTSSTGGHPTEVAYSNVKVWILP